MMMITQREKDENLMIVAAVIGYALKHDIETPDVYDLFRKNDIPKKIRACYDVLHSQSIDESLYFAEDILAQSGREPDLRPLTPPLSILPRTER